MAQAAAVIGFAGRRVIEQTTNLELPENFQTSEFLMEHGMLDAIVTRAKMRFTLGQLLTMLRASPGKATGKEAERAGRH